MAELPARDELGRFLPGAVGDRAVSATLRVNLRGLVRGANRAEREIHNFVSELRRMGIRSRHMKVRIIRNKAPDRFGDLGNIGPEIFPKFNEQTRKMASKAFSRTPIDTGALRASMEHDAHLGKATMTATISFNTPYAVFVHEMLELRHPIGQAKFLSSAVNENRLGFENAMKAALRRSIRKRAIS